MLSFDTETRSFRWWDNPAFLGSWDSGEGGKVAVLPAHTGKRRGTAEFKRALKAENHFVLANAKFDGHMVDAAFDFDLFKPGNKVDDVLMMSRLLFGNKRAVHGLKELARDYVDPEAIAAETAMQEAYKSLTGRTDMAHDDSYFTTWQEHPELVEKYAALDAEYTLALYHTLRPMLRADAKLDKLYREVERPVQTVLYEAEKIGTHVDPEAVERLTKHYQERDGQARQTLQETLGFVPEGEGSEDQLRDALIGAGVPLTEVTDKTGELAVNKRALSPFADHPAVAALFEFRRVNKFLQTYILPLTDTDHIHPTFNQAQAWTGRMSGQNPNMQNLPKRTEVGKDESLKVRSVFVPSPGYEFVVADFDSIEMRVLAYFLGNQAYRQEIDDGDPHAVTAAAAAQIVGLESNKPEDYLKSTDNRWFRDIAKQATYAIVYGGGGRVIAETINKYVLDAGRPEYRVTEDQARAVRRQIADAIPGFKALTETPWRGRTYPQGRLYAQLRKSMEPTDEGKQFGYVRTLLGRKQWIQMWPDEKAYVALSGLIQGSATDIMKAAAIAVHEAMKPYGGRITLFVHDELVVEVPLGWGERLKPIIVEAMEQSVYLDPPLRVEANVTEKSYAHTD